MLTCPRCHQPCPGPALLSPREAVVLHLAETYHTAGALAAAIGRSRKTVEKQLRTARKKLEGK
jgi:DNA-binding CsgD family transcriptional regulator